MFSFHKPKIYRSNLGCCICKAKSSSSRFTDSKKYENEFERCFRIEEKRSGEICNACVLLVKRWKKLSPENRLTKHWHHVVDARAGPGTKLTSTRRLVSPSSSSSALSSPLSSAGHHDASSSGDSPSNCHHHHHQRQHNLPSKYRQDGVLPLSSSQANNQATQNNPHQSSSSNSSPACSSSSNSIRAVGRGGSFCSNKARAIDTNVSTFTFGLDPGRRSYMAAESSYSSPSSSSYLSSVGGSSSSFAKPQSALNSSAFESVIKRYRQRQQQQQLEAQRRQLSRQQRLQQQQLPAEQNRAPLASRAATKRQLANEPQSCQDTDTKSDKASQDGSSSQQEEQQAQVVAASKRLKRSSESIGSISVDGLRVSALLDNSIWRKERICCGIIFRGVYNEVAVFPKLLKPCQCRANKTASQCAQEEPAPAGRAEVSADRELEISSPAPTPRVTKSGSISSCDSNTSGTGSMEQPPAQEKSAGSLQQQPTSKARTQMGQEQRRRPGLRSLNAASNKEEDDTSTSGPASGGDVGRPLVTKAASKRQVAARPRSSARSRTNKLPTAIDTDSNISSSSSVFSSAAGTTTSNSSTRSIKGSSSDRSGGGRASDRGVAGQLVHSPANSSASSNSSGESSSRRLLLMADDVDGDEDELMIDDQDEDLDQEEVDDDEELESNTDASSSVESLTGVQRKKSNASAVGAIG